MLSFLAAVFFLLITPGPGVLSTAGVGSGFGARAGLRYVAGLWLGNNLVGLAVVSGLAAIVFSVPFLREVLAGLSFLYLLYLAAKIALSGSKIAFIHAENAPGFAGGLALQAINPKAYVVNAALYGGFGFWPDALAAEILVKFLLLNAVWIPVHLLWLGAGVGLHRLNLSKRSHLIINAGMALSMLVVVIIAALSSFGS